MTRREKITLEVSLRAVRDFARALAGAEAKAVEESKALSSATVGLLARLSYERHRIAGSASAAAEEIERVILGLADELGLAVGP